MKFPQGSVVSGHVSFSLKDMNLDAGLIVCGRGENLTFLCGNRRIAVDQPGHDAAQGLAPQGKRRYIKEKDIFYFSSQNPSLNRRTQGNNLIRVYSFMRFLAEELAH